MDYGLAVKRPFSDLKKLVIGCVLNIIPIINFFSIGYVLESAKLTLNKKSNLPEWKNWGDLFVHGLLMLIISVIFMLPAIVVGVVAVGAGVLKGLIMNSVLEGLETGGPLLVAALLLLVVAAYLLPMATINYIKRWKFVDAFKLSEIIKKVLTSKYLVVWIVSAVIGFIITIILAIIPLVGGAIGSFISGVITLTLIAQVYLEIK